MPWLHRPPWAADKHDPDTTGWAHHPPNERQTRSESNREEKVDNAEPQSLG